ncbi:MAG: tRNA (adenosine(37)-N6)-threonylcarbamoyltransferase complex ATPase subunit type 1 TsaE [Halanaerobiales bacterium]|nr:tRNA (adenosine(37)-N6)-threonylcarbamoyltransferase complex ATPase subunit type 1 TsaE [Halanaerobiales bacterium]
MIVVTKNVEETKILAKKMGTIIKKNIIFHSQTLLLTGDLGAGKTLFVKGLAEGLEIGINITSPTFNLINEYKANPGLLHMDFYRLDSVQEVFNLGIEEYLEKKAIKAIEWPQLVYKFLINDFILIKIEIISSTKRKLLIKAHGEISQKLLKRIDTDVDIRD